MSRASLSTASANKPAALLTPECLKPVCSGHAVPAGVRNPAATQGGTSQESSPFERLNTSSPSAVDMSCLLGCFCPRPPLPPS